MSTAVVSHVYEDPALHESLFALFDTVWGFLRAKEALAGRLGFAWSRVSTPFAVVEAGRVVAHAGLLPVELVVAGRPVTTGAIHAVCVAADRRGRGLGRRVLTAALAAADERYPAVVLASEKEALYARFGFRARGLHVFAAHGVAGGGGARPLDVSRADDAALWLAAMRTRTALSDRFSVIDRGAINTFDAINRDGTHAPLWIDERLGAVYYARVEGGRVIVDDVFAAGPCDGEALLAGMALAGEAVVFGCDPQRLGLATECVPVAYAAADDRLQIRGALVDDDVPVAWPTYSFT
jgi:GNAT superfamily N-acetyltransferase